MDTLQVIEIIPFRDFKEKINITKEHLKGARVEIIDDEFVYVEKEEIDCD